MTSYDQVKDFINYVEYYPGEDEPGYDHEHDGWKGVREDAPESAKKAFSEFIRTYDEALSDGIKI